MSIYLEMIKVINERGLGRCQTINEVHGCVCLLGARAIARGNTAEEVRDDLRLAYTKEFDDIPELLQLIKEDFPNKWVPYFKPDEANIITNYNDRLIQGHASKAIDILKRAESKRKKNV